MVDLLANFRLFGEVDRPTEGGQGNMTVNFGFNPTGPALSGEEIGRIEYNARSAPITSGVLEPIELPFLGQEVVDFEFSVPFTLDVGQEASIFIGLGTPFIGSAAGGSSSLRLILDFSDNFANTPNSLLGDTLDQGLSLTSITLADGTPLEQANLQFEFIPENTILSAFASAADDQGQIEPLVDTVAGTENRAAVFPFSGTANSKLRGGFNRIGVPTDELVNIDVNPEPNPVVFDVAGGSIGGTNNIRLTNIVPENNPPVAVDDSFATDFETILNVAATGVLSNDIDADGNPAGGGGDT